MVDMNNLISYVVIDGTYSARSLSDFPD
jgi:hypothetical protein